MIKDEGIESFKQSLKINKKVINELVNFDGELWIEIIVELIYEENDSANLEIIKQVSNLAK